MIKKLQGLWVRGHPGHCGSNRDVRITLQEYMAFMISHETENVKSSKEIGRLPGPGSGRESPYATKEELYQNLTPEQKPTTAFPTWSPTWTARAENSPLLSTKQCSLLIFLDWSPAPSLAWPILLALPSPCCRQLLSVLLRKILQTVLLSSVTLTCLSLVSDLVVNGVSVTGFRSSRHCYAAARGPNSCLKAGCPIPTTEKSEQPASSPLVRPPSILFSCKRQINDLTQPPPPKNKRNWKPWTQGV